MAILSFFRSPKAPKSTQKVPAEARAAARVLAPELTDLDHQNLILEVRLANRQAFNQLYLAFHNKLTRFLGRHTKQAHVIEEVVNDTMMVVWQKAHEFRGESKVSTWIMGIAYHTMLKSFRRTEEFVDGESFWQSQQGHYGSHANHPYDASDHPAEEYETQEWLAQGLRLLADDQRVTLELAYIFGHSLEEIADIMACPVSTVKARMFHARVKLRNVLPALGLPNKGGRKGKFVMNHTETPTEASTLSAQEVHRRVWEALPWYINGSADANEKHLVETHLASCLNCQEELQFQQGLAKGMEQTATPNLNAEQGLAHFWRNLAAATAVTPTSANSANANEKPLSDRSNKGSKSRWQLGLAAMLVIQFGGLGLLTYQLQKQTDQTSLLLNQQAALSTSNNYRTLSNEAAQTTSATIRAVLAPSLDMGTLSRQLDALDLQIVTGPNKANIVALAPTTQRFKVEQQVASLRANQGWLLAEIIRPE